METRVFLALFVICYRQDLVYGVDFCASNPCQNSGKCETRGDQGYLCKCPTSHSGVHCETLNECGSNPCQNGGQCVDDLNLYVCKCKPGYTGVNCETDFNECLSSPCVNGATCLNGPGQFTCQCKTGYTGQKCESDINECELSPCKNNGKCQNLVDGFKCKCRPDYLGVRCEIYNEEYGRRTGLVWTVVAVAVVVILIMVIMAISLPLTLRRQRTLDRRKQEGDAGSDVTETGKDMHKKKSRIFTIPGIFRKNEKDTTRPIYFTLTRSSSFEMKVNGDVTFNDLRPMQTTDEQGANDVGIDENSAEPRMNWYLARVTSADGISLSNHSVPQDGQSQRAPGHGVAVSGNISLVDNVFQTPGSGPHVTQLNVN